MKTLKALALFIAGGMTTMYLIARGATTDAEYPREGATVYEDDDMKIVRVGTKKRANMNLATIVYKKKED